MRVVNKTGLFLLVAITCGCAVLWAATRGAGKPQQPPVDGMKEYQKILSRSGLTDPSIHVTGAITWYDHTAPEATQNMTFEFVKNRDEYFSKLAGQVVFCDGENVLRIDTANQVISINKLDKNSSQPLDGGPQMLSRIFADTADARLHATVTSNKEGNVLTLESETVPAVQSCSLYYDPKTYQLNRVLIKWWKEKGGSESFGENVVVTDIQYRFQPFHGFAEGQTVKNVVNIKGHEVQLTPKYKDYKLQTLL